ncbi:Hint domain-containing protein [Acidisoma silvae]|uniref:Hint domain-containing protein n=1 Tax=Acidisoma silvae TaxID=2802396 RepID=A0A964DYJ1_9PROT|nr:Hint domain-containing protein [Acidisoma silvae]MCB8875445.1 Hint domain-containing protein [Acidisoma silvae]
MTTIISSGSVQSGHEIAPVGSGQSLLVEAGGTAISAKITAGTEVISGVDSGAVVTEHGFQVLSSGGLAVGGSVSSDAWQVIHRGAESLSTTIAGGGSQFVSSGGLASAAHIASGGAQILIDEGSAIDTVIDQGAYEAINGNWSGMSTTTVASGSTVHSGGLIGVDTYGTLADVSLRSGGVVLVQSGGIVSGGSIESGGYLIMTPGAVVTDMPAGAAIVQSGIVVIQSFSDVALQSSSLSQDLGSGVEELVLPGGVVSGGTLSSGAALHVYSGGLTSDVTLSGSFEVVSSGGIASGTIIDQASVEYVFSGGFASGTVVVSGFAIVEAGGSATGVTVSAGGNLTVDGSYNVSSVAGVVTGATILDGATLYVGFVGSATDVTVQSGGAAYIFGTLSSGSLESGAYAIVESAVSKVEASGAAGILADSVISGAAVVVESGGVLTGDRISDGSVVLVESGGSSVDTTVSAGGTLILLSGAAVSTTTASGGAIITSGAVAIAGPSSVTVSMGVDSAAVGSGTSAYILSGGVASGVVVQNYGSLEVQSGGTAINTVLTAGGALVVDSGAIVSGAVTFSGIEASIEFSALSAGEILISGFAASDALTFDMISGGSAVLSIISGHEIEIAGTEMGASGLVSAFVSLDPSSSYVASDFTVTNTTSGTAEVTFAPSPKDDGSSLASAAVVPVDIPLYVLPYNSGYKVGIEISLDGGTTYKMYEFDTGGTGFYASYNPAWWSSYTPVSSAPAIFSYTSGNTYTASVVSTNLTFQTTGGNSISTAADIGLISSAENPNTFTNQAWNADLTNVTTSTAPLEDNFYGDFGVGLGSAEDGIENVLAQLGSGLSDGFIITVGTNDSSGEVGNLQVGLTAEDIASYTTVVLMQGENALDTFANSGESTYQELLAEGMYIISGYVENNMTPTSTPTSGTTDYVFDTGAPETQIHIGTTVHTSGTLSGAMLSAGAASPNDSGWVLNVSSGGFQVSDGNAIGNTTGYINTGLNAFWGVSVMFDIADGILGFKLMCFAAGTAIRTPRGDVAVEALRVGDQVRTVTGEARRITWIGHRAIDCRRHPQPDAVLPVCVAAHAFGRGVPERDLYLSPDHAVYLDGVLIPVKYFIDGQNIRQGVRANLTYYHIELSSHDVILAEGLPVETYLAMDDRSSFANGGTVVQAYPVFAPQAEDAQLHWDARGYAPLVVTGPKLDALRRALAERAAPLSGPVSVAAQPRR